MSKVFTITEGLENLGALRTGGQGSVYKGKRIGAIFSAVKLIPTPIRAEDQNDKNYLNFQNEVAKLQKVNEDPNPNVVKIFSSGITESGSFPFIEMEYIEGPDLCELLQTPHEKIFTLKELVKVADQLANALEHCHRVGVKHGDIKSNNVKYNAHTGNYVLLDFGLSIMSDEQRRSSIRHAGAVEFMAPEQSEGKMLLQTDVYSYGVILFELLAGQVPFPLAGNNDSGRNTVMLGHLENILPDVLQLRRSNLPASWTAEKQAQEMLVPSWLLKLIEKCLQKDPSKRFASGLELHEAVISGNLSLPEEEKEPPVLRPLEEQKDSSKIVLSIPVFSVLIGLIIFLMLFSSYSLFIEKEPENRDANYTDSLRADTPERPKVHERVSVPENTSPENEDNVVDTTPVKQADINKQQTIPDSTEDLQPDTSILPQTF